MRSSATARRTANLVKSQSSRARLFATNRARRWANCSTSKRLDISILVCKIRRMILLRENRRPRRRNRGDADLVRTSGQLLLHIQPRVGRRPYRNCLPSTGHLQLVQRYDAPHGVTSRSSSRTRRKTSCAPRLSRTPKRSLAKRSLIPPWPSSISNASQRLRTNTAFRLSSTTLSRPRSTADPSNGAAISLPTRRQNIWTDTAPASADASSIPATLTGWNIKTSSPA